jgi:hypothetical protein
MAGFSGTAAKTNEEQLRREFGSLPFLTVSKMCKKKYRHQIREVVDSEGKYKSLLVLEYILKKKDDYKNLVLIFNTKQEFYYFKKYSIGTLETNTFKEYFRIE